MAIIEGTSGDWKFFISDNKKYLKNLQTGEILKVIQIPKDSQSFGISETDKNIEG